MSDFWQALTAFFNSSFFIGLVTAVAASVAFILYTR